MKRIVGILPEDYTIVDPFMGSGTTGVACKLLNRNFIGIEMDKANFRKKIRPIPLISHDEKQMNVKHRPAKLFSFNSESYEELTAKESYQFKM
jgi:DNA modification methylase